MNKKIQLLVFALTAIFSVNAQNTIEINGQELFLSGTNLAWNQFGGDVGFGNNPDLTYFDNFFGDVADAGGNSVRWWLHTDATFTPTFDDNGFCAGLHDSMSNDEIIAQIASVLDKAWENKIYVTISLFSFDMLQDPTNKESWSNINFSGNKAFLESDTNVQSYIDNALTPMVNALKDHPALGPWEIFNEPEGMASEFGWTGNQGGAFVNMVDIQMVVNKLTGAIHDADPTALVTNGSWSMLANCDKNISNNSNQKNYYSDSELVAAGGASNGTLDFYQVHYYSWQDAGISPFHHEASYWELDKPILIGEYFVNQVHALMTSNGYDENASYDFLYDNGYCGAWGWQYNESGPWSDIEPAIEFMFDTNPEVVTIANDADGDGVPDSIDRCSNTPMGEAVNVNGCSALQMLDDNDSDTVVDNDDLYQNTPAGAIVDADGGVALPTDSFVISSETPTCPGKENASIIITSSSGYTFGISVFGIGYSQTFNNISAITGFDIDDLVPGVYSITFKFVYGADIEFTVTIDDAPTITGKRASKDLTSKTATYTVAGDTHYELFINGIYQRDIEFLDVLENQITVQLKSGNSFVKIASKNACRGSIDDNVSFGDIIECFPNPSNNVVNIQGLKSNKVTVYVLNTVGSIVSKSEHQVSYGKINFSMIDKPTGLYLLQVIGEEDNFQSKIIRK